MEAAKAQNWAVEPQKKKKISAEDALKLAESLQTSCLTHVEGNKHFLSRGDRRKYIDIEYPSIQ
jgi:hypothetical protein